MVFPVLINVQCLFKGTIPVIFTARENLCRAIYYRHKCRLLEKDFNRTKEECYLKLNDCRKSIASVSYTQWIG